MPLTGIQSTHDPVARVEGEIGAGNQEQPGHEPDTGQQSIENEG